MVEVVRKAGSEALGVICDVANYEPREAMIGASVKAFGRATFWSTTPHCLLRSSASPLNGLRKKSWVKAMAVNVRGPFNTVKAVLPQMKKQK
jgi:NAD(P)-dependent dehydrogenase (short-subunit alcohol dehydrogenase family)